MIPRARRSGTAARLSTTWLRATAAGLADRGQVDGRRPGQQQPHVAVDGGPRLGVEPQVEGLESRRRGRPRYAVGERREVLKRASGADLSAGPGHPPVVVHRAVRAPLPASIVRGGRASVSVSRRPFGSGPGFPVTPRGRRSPGARRRADADGRVAPGARQGWLSTNRRGGAKLWITHRLSTVPGTTGWTPRAGRQPSRGCSRGPAGPACAGRRRSPRRRTGRPRPARPPSGRSPGRGPRGP